MITAISYSPKIPASRQRVRALIWTVVFLLFAASACEKKRAEKINSAGAESFAFNRLLALPFERSDGVICPLCRRSVLSCRMEQDAESSLNKLLMERLRGIPGIELVSQEDINRAVMDVPEPERTRLQLSPDFALRVAKKVNADAVMRNFVFCYRERQGNAASVSRPAAVSFHLHLYNAGSGETAWIGRFEEEQAALSENILQAPDFFRRGGKWVRVEALAQEGMSKAMKDFPGPGGAGQ